MLQTPIVERVLGYTDQMMIDYIQSMLNAVKGVGVTPHERSKIKAFRPDFNPLVVERLERSLKAYKGGEIDPEILKYPRTPEESLPAPESPDLDDDDDEDQSESEMDAFELRAYQQEAVDKAIPILNKYGFVYLAMQMRTGKTFTALEIADKVSALSVLIVTKKKAMSSIKADYETLSPWYEMEMVNWESLHKYVDYEKNKFIGTQVPDLLILDEAHSMGAYPKPSKRAKQIKALVRAVKCKVIMLSGTPTPESFSQMYHQVYGLPNNPFAKYSNFYRFADDYVKVVPMRIDDMERNNYDRGLPTILEAMRPFTVSLTQVDAGFKSKIKETVLHVDMKAETMEMIRKLSKRKVLEGKTETLLADTAVKLMSKTHQLCSGTVKFESGNAMTIDTTKAQFIANMFPTEKLGIFYKFTQELKVLQSVLGERLTTDMSVFEDTDKSIALQIVSGREGVNLSKADYLVYYNIDFSATSYWQSRERMSTLDRPETEVFWVFSTGGIEDSIYKTVLKKRNYTTRHFDKYIESI